jgi:hypothetical protein
LPDEVSVLQLYGIYTALNYANVLNYRAFNQFEAKIGARVGLITNDHDDVVGVLLLVDLEKGQVQVECFGPGTVVALLYVCLQVPLKRSYNSNTYELRSRMSIRILFFLIFNMSSVEMMQSW